MLVIKLLLLFAGFRGVAWFLHQRGGTLPGLERREAYRLVDRGDGLLGQWRNLGLLFLTGAAGMGVLWLCGHPGTPVSRLIMGSAGIGLLVYAIRGIHKIVHDVSLSRPGELVVPHWPLAEGEVIEAKYARQVAPSCRLKRIQAKLELVEQFKQVHRRSDGRREVTYHWRVIDTVPLPEGEGAQDGPTISGTWKVKVPPYEGFEPPVGRERIAQLLGICPHRKWRIRVDFDVNGLPDHDSNFVLGIRAGG